MSTGKVIKNSMIYSIVSILQKAVGFFLLPVYTVYLTTNDYGIVAMITTLVSFVSIFTTLSLNGAATYFTYEKPEDKLYIKKLWGTILTVIIINSMIICILLIFFHVITVDKVMKGIVFYPYILTGIATVTFSSVYLLYQTYLQTIQDGKKYGMNNILFFGTNITLTLLTVIVFKMGAIGVITASLITNVIFAIYALFDFYTKIEIGINIEILKKSLKYSLPLLPHSLSGWIMTMIDRILLNSIQSTASVGLYNIGFQFGNLMNIITGAITQAYSPWLFENLKKREGLENIRKFTQYGIIFYSIIGLIIAMLSKEIISFMVSYDFKDSWRVVPILVFSNVFTGYYYFFVGVLFEKDTKLVPLVTFIGGITTVGFNYMLIPRYSYIGAAVSNLFSSFVVMLVTYFIAIKIKNLNIPIFKFLGITGICGLIASTSYLFDNKNTIIILSIKLTIIILVLICFIYKYRSEIFLVLDRYKKRGK